MDEQRRIADFLSDASLRQFVFGNLRQSLGSIGFSEELVAALLKGLDSISVEEFDVEKFGSDFKTELDQVYNIGFFQKYVPDYFLRSVVPITPSVSKILDVGCGTGILAHLYAQTGRFTEVVAIDINPYPEWESFKRDGIAFSVVEESDFNTFLNTAKPDALVLTWTLHHMEFEEQKRYVRYIYDALKPQAQVVILEDAYSTERSPENGEPRHDAFMSHSASARANIMSVYDWVANRVLAQRSKVPIPFGYRTLEEWIGLFEEVGFHTVEKKFIGFPDFRDINTPQALLVLQK